MCSSPLARFTILASTSCPSICSTPFVSLVSFRNTISVIELNINVMSMDVMDYRPNKSISMLYWICDKVFRLVLFYFHSSTDGITNIWGTQSSANSVWKTLSSSPTCALFWTYGQTVAWIKSGNRNMSSAGSATTIITKNEFSSTFLQWFISWREHANKVHASSPVPICHCNITVIVNT